MRVRVLVRVRGSAREGAHEGARGVAREGAGEGPNLAVGDLAAEAPVEKSTFPNAASAARSTAATAALPMR